MKIDSDNERTERLKDKTSLRPKLSILLILALTFTLLGCGDSSSEPDEDESGIIGTGILLQGTIEDTLLAENSKLEAFSATGTSEVIAINSNGAFNTDVLKGEAPWLLRVQINSERELFAMAYSDGTRNINSFSDAGLRRSLARRSVNPDTVINASDRSSLLPSSLDYDESVNSIANLVELVFDSYGVTSTDLISTPYASNGTGIDAFLTSNNVVIDNDLITFQVTDPKTNIQAETRTATNLTSSFVDNGTGPSQPGNVRALNGGMNDIVLVWDPSVDDINVAGYAVLRDGVFIGNTPFPQFIDAGLEDNQSYSYIITALDSAGNSSAPSLPVTGSTAPITPSSAPLSPTNLSLVSASSRSIRLSWNPPTNLAVARYNLYRGILSTTPTELQQVTTTTALDTAIAVGLTYCYQVSAVNVVGLESARSATVCVDATDDTTASTSTVMLSDWNIPNTDVNCSDILTTTDVPVGRTTLSTGCYSVPRTLEIRTGATLQIDEGVILKFGDAAKISVEGTLTVLGSRDNPVVFTGETETPGFWGGVQFTGTNTTNNVLRGAVVQYGGGGDVTGAVSARFNNTRFSMEDTLVQYNEGFALFFNIVQIRITSFDGNLIFANDNIGSVIATAAQSLAGSTRYIDNVVNELTIQGINFTGVDVVIADVGIPISWSGLTIENGSLTILPGADLELLGSTVIDVDGPVVINGEPDRPITLRGRSTSTQGTWDGLLLSGSGNKVLNHVNISHAGASGVDRGAVEIDCTDDSNINVQINNTDISDSASWGIYFAGGDCAVEIGSSVTYSNNGVGDSNVP